MNDKNKTIVLAIAGLVIGGIAGAIINSEELSVAMLAGMGGVAGFLIGWVWQSRSGKSDE